MTGSSPERVSFCRAQSAVALGSSKAPSAAGPFPPDLRPWHRSFRSLAVSSSRRGGGGGRRRGGRGRGRGSCSSRPFSLARLLSRSSRCCACAFPLIPLIPPAAPEGPEGGRRRKEVRGLLSLLPTPRLLLTHPSPGDPTPASWSWSWSASSLL